MQNPKLKVVSNIIPHLKNSDRVVFNFWGSPLPPSTLGLQSGVLTQTVTEILPF